MNELDTDWFVTYDGENLGFSNRRESDDDVRVIAGNLDIDAYSWDGSGIVYDPDYDDKKQASESKKADRSQAISAGVVWNGNKFQTRERDQKLITGRAATFNSLITLGRATLDDTEYVDAYGDTQSVSWRTEDDITIYFTIREYLEFAMTVDAFVDSKFKASWGE